MYQNRTIIEVWDVENRRVISADSFFEKPKDEIFNERYELQKIARTSSKPRYTCLYCKQRVRILGSFDGGKKRLHFAHYKDSDDCPIKTGTQLTVEEINRLKYNGVKEGFLHYSLKTKIAENLESEASVNGRIKDIEIEKVLLATGPDKGWKKPDISFKYDNKRIVIELQLSTTFLSVIESRQDFYQNEHTFVLWVFREFVDDDERRRFTDNDVIYSNNQNAFIYDQEMESKSLLHGKLYMKCFYKVYDFCESQIVENWQETEISIEDLLFDEEQYKIYYFDSNASKICAKEKFEKYNNQYLALIREVEDYSSLIEANYAEIEELQRKSWSHHSNKNYLTNKQQEVNYELRQLEFLNLNQNLLLISFVENSSNSTVPYKLAKRIETTLANVRLRIGSNSISFSKSLKELSNLKSILTSINSYVTYSYGGEDYCKITIVDKQYFLENYRQIFCLYKSDLNSLLAHESMFKIDSATVALSLLTNKDILFLVRKKDYVTRCETRIKELELSLQNENIGTYFSEYEKIHVYEMFKKYHKEQIEYAKIVEDSIKKEEKYISEISQKILKYESVNEKLSNQITETKNSINRFKSAN